MFHPNSFAIATTYVPSIAFIFGPIRLLLLIGIAILLGFLGLALNTSHFIIASRGLSERGL